MKTGSAQRGWYTDNNGYQTPTMSPKEKAKSAIQAGYGKLNASDEEIISNIQDASQRRGNGQTPEEAVRKTHRPD